jgi:hypothetical protein
MFELSSNVLTKLAFARPPSALASQRSVGVGVKTCAGKAVANLFIPNKFQVSNESLILAQNQRWRRA